MLNLNDTRKRATNATQRKDPDYKSRVINMTLTALSEPAILHEYMAQYHGLMTSMFERLGGRRQLVQRNPALLDMISLWHKTSLSNAQKQLFGMCQRRETLPTQLTGKIILREIKTNEALLYAAINNEEVIERIKSETVALLSGVTVRIAKAKEE